MNTRRNVARRFQEEISNAGVPPRGDQVPLLVEDVNNYQASANPYYLIDSDIRVAFINIAQTITTQTLAATTQALASTAQANSEVVPLSHQQVVTMASHLRDFTRINFSYFYGSMV